MEKAKQLEKIQLEYDLFEVDGDVTLGRVFTMISTNTEEVDVARSLIDLEKRRNRRRRFISSVLGKHAERFGYLDSWYYDMDDSYLDKKSVVLDKYYSQLNDFWSALNDNNTQEIYRLMSFTRAKNRGYRLTIEEERQCIKKSANGEEFERPVVTDNFNTFNEWFEGALEKASYTQNVEKVKK